MSHVAALVFGIAGLLALIALLPPLASRLRLPYTVLLAIVGCALGVGIGLTDHMPTTGLEGPLVEFFKTLGRLSITSEVFLWVFLPLLLFEISLNLDARDLWDDVLPILTLAILAVLLCALVAGTAVWLASDLRLLACLLLASIIATTDPAAVIAIFREVGAPRRLVTLVEGESLLNDAAAIALATAILGALLGSEPPDAGQMTSLFIQEFVGGAILGAGLGRLAGLLISRLDQGGPGEITLSLALAYLAYALADSFFHVSGVVSVVIAGLVFGAHGRARIGTREWEALSGIWSQIGFWASSLIFVLASMVVPDTLATATMSDLGALAALIVAALLARALTLFGLLPLLGRLLGSQPIEGRFKTVIVWGGLRGAVTLALALSVSENHLVAERVRHMVSVLSTGFVLFTLLVQGVTLRWMIRWLGLDKLSPVERLLRVRALDLARAEVRDELSASAILHGLDLDSSRVTKEILAAPSDTADGEQAAAGEELQHAQLVSALATVVARERVLLVDEIGSRMISRSTGARALRDTSLLLDAVRAEGLPGYRASVRRLQAFDRQTRFAAWLHRTFSITAPLAFRLAERVELFLVKRRVVEELLGFTRSRIKVLVSPRAAEAIARLLDARLEQIDRILDALQLQYPNYWQQALDQYLGRIAIRLEWQHYERMRSERIISPQLFQNLAAGLRTRQRRLEVTPRLDLGLDVSAMLRRVPLFQQISDDGLRQLRRLLRPRLALPDERIVRRGEVGEAMYFIISGAVEVILPSEPVRLGTGEFFGELALIQRRPRNADVVALGYCELLELRRDAFRQLLKLDPSLMQEVRQVAERRLRAAPGTTVRLYEVPEGKPKAEAFVEPT